MPRASNNSFSSGGHSPKPSANWSKLRSSKWAGTSTTRVTAPPARRGGGEQAACASKGGVPCGHRVGVRERGLHRVSGEEPGERGGAEHVAAAGGVERVDRGSAGTSGRSGRRGRVAAAGLALAPAVEPRGRDVGGAPGAQGHHQQRDAGRHCLGGEHQRIGRELAHLILIELDHVEAAEPLGGVGQGWSTRIPSCCMPRNRLCRSA